MPSGFSCFSLVQLRSFCDSSSLCCSWCIQTACSVKLCADWWCETLVLLLCAHPRRLLLFSLFFFVLRSSFVSVCHPFSLLLQVLLLFLLLPFLDIVNAPPPYSHICICTPSFSSSHSSLISTSETPETMQTPHCNIFQTLWQPLMWNLLRTDSAI